MLFLLKCIAKSNNIGRSNLVHFNCTNSNSNNIIDESTMTDDIRVLT